MIFHILICIVFISEIIITANLFYHLIKLDKTFIKASEFINNNKENIRYISKISNKISEQLLELAPYWVDNIKKHFENLMLLNIKNIVVGTTLLLIKKKMKIKFSKRLKILKLIQLFY